MKTLNKTEVEKLVRAALWNELEGGKQHQPHRRALASLCWSKLLIACEL